MAEQHVYRFTGHVVDATSTHVLGLPFEARAERERFGRHVREVTRLGRAPYERIITLATRDMTGPWDGVLTHVAVENGAAR